MKNIELLKKLCTAVGVSGEEDAVRALILEEIEPLADRVEVTPLGNIVAFKQGEKRPVKKLMLCAHMDEVGLVVTNITEDGFLKFETVGGIRPAVLSGRAVCVERRRARRDLREADPPFEGGGARKAGPGRAALDRHRRKEPGGGRSCRADRRQRFVPAVL